MSGELITAWYTQLIMKYIFIFLIFMNVTQVRKNSYKITIFLSGNIAVGLHDL